MNQNGIVLLHDIKVGENDFGVYELWNELKRKYSTIEFFQSFGLGVLFLNKNIGKEMESKEQEWQMHYSYIHEGIRSQIIEQISEKIVDINQNVQRKELEIQSIRQDLKRKEQIIQSKEQLIGQKNQEILIMESSIFWKLRKAYLYIINKIINLFRIKI
jgi:hypothetical protein